VSTTEIMPPEQRNIFPTRLYYLVWFAGLGFVSPFLNLFFVHLGLNGTEIGWVSASVSVVTLIAAPFCANRNDRWRNPRSVLQLLLFFAGLGYLWLSQQVLFWGIVLVSVLQAFVGAGVPALSDAFALRVTETSKAGYGSIRVYGSLGWMIFVLLAGWVVEHTELKSSLIGAACFTLLAAIVLFSIEGQNFASTKQEASAGVRNVIGKLLKNRPMLGVAFMIVLIGITGSGVYQFQGVFLGQLGASPTIIGIAGMAASVVELPFMLWSDSLTQKWGSYRLLQAAMLTFVIARGIIFVFPSIPLIIVAEAASGTAYSFLTVALVRFIAEQTDEHDTRTVLALYTVTLTSLIGIISGPVIGFAFDKLGALSLYLIAAVGYTLAWLGLYLTRPSGASALADTAS
jgi:PPP family 3-phenylpropionic acid transporter